MQTFLERLRAPSNPEEALRIERVLATARAILAGSALVAVYFDASNPARFAELAYILLVVYLAQCVLVFGWLRLRSDVPRWLVLGVHASDVIWPAVITLFTEGPTSPFFVLFSFALLAAAYRWGFRETVMTAAAVISLLFAEIIFVTVTGYGALFVEEFELNRAIMRSAYIMILGLLLGYLADEDKLLRAETTTVARVMGLGRVDVGLRGTMRDLLREIQEIFGARQVLLAANDTSNQRFFLWELWQASSRSEATVHLSELESNQAAAYFAGSVPAAWFCTQSGAGKIETAGLEEGGGRLRTPPNGPSDAFLSLHPFRSLMGVSFRFGEDWEGRLFVLDPAAESYQERELRFLQRLLAQIGPSVYSVYLLQRLRARAGAMERARVARDLHDGILQSLIAVEMRVDVLRRRAAGQPPAIADELAHIQDALRQEVQDLRELMEQMRPVNLTPQQLLDFLADAAEKFQRATGIATTFVCEREEVALSPRVCRELARIVQEALVNVRKHSGAQHVVVRFAAHNGRWKLVVDDDGRGFPFAGRFDLAQLDSERKGPLVIKERVRSLGGEITVESTPGRGSRLEITLPSATAQ